MVFEFREPSWLAPEVLAALEKANVQLQAQLETLVTQLPRLFLIESEYYLAQRRAEEGWVRGLLEEFTVGTFPGLDDWRRFHATGEVPDYVQGLVELERGRAADT